MNVIDNVHSMPLKNEDHLCGQRCSENVSNVSKIWGTVKMKDGEWERTSQTYNRKYISFYTLINLIDWW